MKIDLDVPFDEKDEAKRLGAEWDYVRKTWYVDESLKDYDPENFSRWLIYVKKPTGHHVLRVILNVPFSEKDEAKKLGAMWDAEQKTWFVVGAEDLTPFLKWIDDRAEKPVTTGDRPPWE